MTCGVVSGDATATACARTTRSGSNVQDGGVEEVNNRAWSKRGVNRKTNFDRMHDHIRTVCGR